MSPRAKALVMRKRSYYLSKQQHRQLRFMLAAVLALPIFTIGALVFIFPDILDLSGEGMLGAIRIRLDPPFRAA